MLQHYPFLFHARFLSITHKRTHTSESGNGVYLKTGNMTNSEGFFA